MLIFEMIVLTSLLCVSLDDDNDNVINVTNKRYMRSNKSLASPTKQNCFGTNPKIKYEQLLNENIQLKKQIQEYQKHWMPKWVLYLCSIFPLMYFFNRPDGEVKSYLIQLGKSLSNNSDLKPQGER